MPSVEFGGITPTLVVDTHFIQNESEVAKKIQVTGTPGRLKIAKSGVCLSMVCDWFQKCETLHEVSHISELKTSLGYSLAQTAYVRNVFDTHASDTRVKKPSPNISRRFVESHGLEFDEFKEDYDLYNSREQGVQSAQHIATKLSGTWSNYIIIIGGTSGHALGYNASLNQFLDPNIGILKFTSQTDFARWLAAFLLAKYPRFMSKGYELIKLNRKED